MMIISYAFCGFKAKKSGAPVVSMTKNCLPPRQKLGKLMQFWMPNWIFDT